MATDTQTVRLELEGMTCAACASRIERKLNKLEGVEATVNYATEQAAVSFDATKVAVADVVAAVEAIAATEPSWARELGKKRMADLRELLQELCAFVDGDEADA